VTEGAHLTFYDPRVERGWRRYAVLEPGDKHYNEAAALFHACKQLGVTERGNLLYAFADHWPKQGGSGRHADANRDLRGVLTHTKMSEGWTAESVAEASGYSVREVNRWRKHGEDILEENRVAGTEPRIESSPGEPEVMTKYPVPPRQAELWRREYAWVSRLPDTLRDILGPLAPFSAVGPPSPEQVKQLRQELAARSAVSSDEEAEPAPRDHTPWWLRRPGDQA